MKQAHITTTVKTARIVDAKLRLASITETPRHQIIQAMIIYNNPTATATLVERVDHTTSDKPQIFTFTASDVVDGKVNFRHDFNVDAVDVTTYNDQRQMIGLETVITPNDVTLFIKQQYVIGTWKVLVEKL